MAHEYYLHTKPHPAGAKLLESQFIKGSLELVQTSEAFHHLRQQRLMCVGECVSMYTHVSAHTHTYACTYTHLRRLGTFHGGPQSRKKEPMVVEPAPIVSKSHILARNSVRLKSKESLGSAVCNKRSRTRTHELTH